MKKLSALLLTFIMVISLIVIPVSATTAAVTFDALTDATNYFYDNGGAANEALLGDLMLRPNEWASYDVSNLEGTYEVSITYIQNQGAGTYYNFIAYSVDNEWQLTSKHLYTNGVAWGGTAVSSGALGNVIIGADSKYLKVKNSGRFNFAIDKITLTPVESGAKAPVKLYGENITSTAQSGAAVAGTDYYDVAGSTFAADFNTVRNLSDVNYLALHNEDWARFDISGLAAGDYNLSLNYINYAGVEKTATLTLKVDGVSVLSKTIARQTTAATLELGSVTIAKGAKYLVAEVVAQDTNALYIDSFNFTSAVAEGGAAGDETITAPTDVTKTNGTATEGTDYHDEANLAFGTAIQSIRDFNGIDYLALHSGDWVRYDISDWSAGTYNVGINYINYAGVEKITTLTLKVDGVTVLTKEIGRQTSAATLELGSVTIAKGAKYLVVEASAQDTNAIYIEKINASFVTSGLLIDATAPTSGNYTYIDAAKTALKLDPTYNTASFDVSAISAGTYDVFATIRTTAADIAVNLTGATTRESLLPNTAGAYVEHKIGTVKFTDSAKTFTIDFTHATANVCIKDIKIEVAVLPVIDISFETFGKGGTKINTIADVTKAYAVIDLSAKAEALGVKVFVAVYEGDTIKEMKYVEPLDASNVSSYKNVVTLNNLNENSEVKVFVWDAESYAPIAEPTVISTVAPV